MNDQKSLSITLMKIWSIMIPAFFFSIVTDTFHIFLFSMVASITSTLRSKPIQLTLRSGIYGVVIALTVIVLSNTIVKIEDRFVMSPAEIAVPTSLIFAMTLLYYDDRPSFTACSLIMCIFSLMMCGDINSGHIYKNLPLPATLGRMENISNLYILCLVLCAAPYFFLMNRSHFNIKNIVKKNRRLAFAKMGIILASLALVLLLYKPTQQVIVPFSKTLEAKMAQFLSKWRKNNKRRAFENNVNLRDSYFSPDGEALNVTLMRVKSKTAPGYMRSKIYDHYFDGSWKSDNKPFSMRLLIEEHNYSYNTYSFNGLKQTDLNKLDKLTVYYSGNFVVQNIVHMGKTRYVEMTCEGLLQTPDGTVTGKGLDFSSGITLYNDKDWKTRDPSFPAPVLTDQQRAHYLQIDDEGEIGLKERLLKYFERELDRSSTDKFANSIVAFFEDNFTYKLGVKLETKDEPIFKFLEKRQGHCELYATTTVMLLRAHNIPARYVTGFYCTEQHPAGDYYIGRAKDLHAWVEYYDDNSKSWLTLEPTPPGSMPNSASEFNFFTSNWDKVSLRWQELMANIVKGYFAEAVILFLKGILDIFIWCFSSPLKAIISLALIAWYLTRRKKKKETATLFSRDFNLLKNELNKMITQIKKLKNFSTTPAMTLGEMATALESREEVHAANYAACLREYEALRYNELKRNDEKVRITKAKFKTTLKARIR